MASGFLTWAAIAAAILIAAPVIIICVMIWMSRRPGGLSPDTLHTRGLPLDALAPIYDRYCPMIGLGPAFRAETIRHAGLKEGENILDVGCGTGVLTRLAAKEAGSAGYVVGIDPAAKMIAIALDSASTEGSKAEFRLAVIETLPFEDDTFDCVLSSAMLHHLPPDVKDKGLSDVRRVLKPGGRLVVVDVDMPSNPLWWILLWPLLFWSHTKGQISGSIGEMMRNAGFANVKKLGSWGGFLGFWRGFKAG